MKFLDNERLWRQSFGHEIKLKKLLEKIEMYCFFSIADAEQFLKDFPNHPDTIESEARLEICKGILSIIDKEKLYSKIPN